MTTTVVSQHGGLCEHYCLVFINSYLPITAHSENAKINLPKYSLLLKALYINYDAILSNMSFYTKNQFVELFK